MRMTKRPKIDLDAAPLRRIVFNVDLNNAGVDVATLTDLPEKFIVRRCTVFDASVNMTGSPATLGLYTGAGATGVTIVPPATLTGLTAATKFVDMTLAAAVGTDYQTPRTIYLNNGVAHGAACTVTVVLEVQDCNFQF